MKILYINNDGAGFADFIEVAPGTTMDKFVAEKVSGKPSDYLIRVYMQSFVVFVISFGIMTAALIHNETIRPGPKQR